MGQYFRVVNLTKKQYLKPHDFNNGPKLMEFGASGGGTMNGLAILLADGNGRGGGDCRSESPLIGSWAGDRIVITGDYADHGKFCPEGSDEKANLYDLLDGFENISAAVKSVLKEDADG